MERDLKSRITKIRQYGLTLIQITVDVILVTRTCTWRSEQ